MVFESLSKCNAFYKENAIYQEAKDDLIETFTFLKKTLSEKKAVDEAICFVYTDDLEIQKISVAMRLATTFSIAMFCIIHTASLDHICPEAYESVQQLLKDNELDKNRDLLHEEDYRLLKIDEPLVRQYMHMECANSGEETI